MILLQIVLVSRGTHLVKNRKSQSRTKESQLKKHESEIENAWAFMQQDRLQTSVLQYTEFNI